MHCWHAKTAPHIITQVWKQRNLLVYSPTGARRACRSPGILPGHCTLLRRGCQAPSSASCLGFSSLLAVRSPKQQSWDVTAHSVYNGWEIKSTQESGLEHDVWIWQEKGGVVGLNEVASVRVGSIRHRSIPSSFHCSLSTSQICWSSFHLRCQAGWHVLHAPTPLVFSICHRKKPYYWWSTKWQSHQHS